MAISKNLYTRGLRQRLAGAAWYQRKGETVVRELAASVSNPQTEAQMAQRSMLANLVAMYRANLFWMKSGAFESKKQVWSDYNAFVSANSKAQAPYLTKGMVEQGATIVMPYVVTKGSLPIVNVLYDRSNEYFRTDLYLSTPVDETTVVGTLSTELMENNNGLQVGDQISFIINYQRTEGVPFVTARAYELIIDPSDTSTLEERGLGDVITSDEVEGGIVVLTVTTQNPYCGCAVIVSRDTSSGIKVSTQSLVLAYEQAEYVSQFTTPEAFQEYADSYGSERGANFLSRGYAGIRSESVALALAIQTVNGKAGGSYLGTGNANNETLSIVFNKTVDNLNVQSVSVNPNNAYHNVSVTGASGRTVTASTTGSTSGNGQIIRGVTVRIDDVDYSVAFSGDSNSEGQTE